MVFGNGKNLQGSAQLLPLSLSPQPSEFCNDEHNCVVRSAMDALRNSKKISLLAVAILFLFTFFNLILDVGSANYHFYFLPSVRTKSALCAFGECAKPRKKVMKLILPRLMLEQQHKNCRSFISTLDRMDGAKKHLTRLSL